MKTAKAAKDAKNGNNNWGKTTEISPQRRIGIRKNGNDGFTQRREDAKVKEEKATTGSRKGAKAQRNKKKRQGRGSRKGAKAQKEIRKNGNDGFTQRREGAKRIKKTDTPAIIFDRSAQNCYLSLMQAIDIHTHAFPDALADRAMAFLEAEGNVKAALDGRVSSLLASMDKAGIEKSAVCSIATKPSQFKPIFEWSKHIASERIVPFPSIHPDDPQAIAQIVEIHAAGFKGIKLHPYYQRFILDDPRMDSIYEAIQDRGLLLLCHTGFDLAYPHDRVCDPRKIMAVLGRFPELRMITSHLGAWEDWEEVRRHMIGKRVLIDTSYSIPMLGREAARELILLHPADCLLFGSDSPWADQSAAIKEITDLNLPEGLQQALLYDNAARILNAAGAE